MMDEFVLNFFVAYMFLPSATLTLYQGYNVSELGGNDVNTCTKIILESLHFLSQLEGTISTIFFTRHFSSGQ